VFDQQYPFAERGLDPLGLALKETRPLRVIVDDQDRPDQWRQLTDKGSPDLLLSLWYIRGRQSLL